MSTGAVRVRCVNLSYVHEATRRNPTGRYAAVLNEVTPRHDTTTRHDTTRHDTTRHDPTRCDTTRKERTGHDATQNDAATH